jgi:hypothetical protein
VRDGIEIARRGTPGVAIVTERFEAQGAFVALAAGMPDYPRVVVPHPIAGRDAASMKAIASATVSAIVSGLGIAP